MNEIRRQEGSISQRNHSAEALYPVNDCYSCVQGEGVQTGVAMVLLRLHGCNVGCPWCDTQETWKFDPRNEQSAIPKVLGSNGKFAYADADAISNYIQKNHQGPKWVLVTGGEPAQYSLRMLVDTLHNKQYKVALETSGTETGHIGAGFDWVCVSPKINMPGKRAVLPIAFECADEIKHVVGTQWDIQNLDELLTQVTLKPTVQICLQPVSLSPKATQLCIEVVQRRGWRLSVQLHKYINQR